MNPQDRRKALMRARSLFGGVPGAYSAWETQQARLAHVPDAADNEIRIYGLILPDADVAIMRDWFGDDSAISGRMFRDAMQRHNGDVMVRINSDGGDAHEASMMVQAIQERGMGAVKCTIDGVAASAATLVSSVCSDVTIAQMGTFMIHSAASYMYGNGVDFRKAADYLESLDGQAASIYAKRTGGKTADMLALMADETYMNPEQAVEHGFADRVMDMDDDEQEAARMAAFKTRQVDFASYRDHALQAVFA